MRKFAFLCFALIFLSGCATTNQNNTLPSKDLPQEASGQVNNQTVSPDLVKEVQTKTAKIKNEQVQALNSKVAEDVITGTVFGNVTFSGILNKPYVTFSISRVTRPEYKFQLHIGNKKNKEDPTRTIYTDQNGYFFMTLPEGQYQITSISIPVSSTLAVEMIDIIFDVNLNEAAYIGHLSVEGTKEKIHWGGIPVVKPGFEYLTTLKKDEWEAYNFYKRIFPDSTLNPVTRMMKVRPLKVDMQAP